MPRLRLLAMAAVATLATAVTVTPSADSATVVGETVAPTAPDGCTGFFDFDGFQETRGGQDSAVKVSGVVTSWRFEAGPTTSSKVALRVYRKAPVAGQWQPVTDYGTLQTVPAASGLHGYPSRMPVAAGDYVGLHANSGGCFANVPAGGDNVRYLYESTILATGTAANFGNLAAIFDLAVTIEPDADLDGYGDETQDGCPTSATTQASCTDTTITKKPSRKSHGPKSKLKFTASVAGSTFSCVLDKHAAAPCTSPVNYKCLRAGKHTFSVTATSPFGYADPTPASAKFRVHHRAKSC